jgi:hypothetical protein
MRAILSLSIASKTISSLLEFLFELVSLRVFLFVNPTLFLLFFGEKPPPVLTLISMMDSAVFSLS